MLLDAPTRYLRRARRGSHPFGLSSSKGSGSCLQVTPEPFDEFKPNRICDFRSTPPVADKTGQLIEAR